MSLVGFLWREDAEWMAVLPPDMGAPLWSEWLMRQDASLRRLSKKVDVPYWLVSPSLVNDIQERFIVAGWVIEYKDPFSGVAGDMDEFLKGFQQAAQGDPRSGKGPIHNLSKHTGVMPYQLLFLRPNAPRCVVDASYRSLMKEVHSDVNEKGEEASKILNNARDNIYKERGW